jgi:hypothetical protein
MHAWLDPRWYFASPGLDLSSGHYASHTEAGDALTAHDLRGDMLFWRRVQTFAIMHVPHLWPPHPAPWLLVPVAGRN